MQWFKLYHNSDSSLFIQKVMKKDGKEGYANWIFLLSLLCEKFDGNSILIKLTVDEVAKKLRVKSGRVESIIRSFSELGDNQVVSLLELHQDETNLLPFIMIIKAPILLDLMDKDFARARSKRGDSALRIRDKNKNKDKEEETETVPEPQAPPVIISPVHQKLDTEFIKPYLASVKIRTQEAWFETYDDEAFVKMEIMKACTWILNNGRKAPKKNLGQFFSTWLGTAWNNYRKTLQGNQKTFATKGVDGRDMATKIYSQVLHNGMHGLKETLKSLEPIEVRALEKFGLASEIINCPSDFAATDIKNRLKIACEQVIQEQVVAS